MRKTKESRIQNYEIERPTLGRTLLASFLNALFVLTGALLGYFAICYPSMALAPSTRDAKVRSDSLKESLSLNLPANLDYKNYEKVVQDFYFVSYPKEIVDVYGKAYGDLSIEALYNIRVLALPEHPTSSNYSTAYFSYSLNDDGSVNQDVVGTIKPDLNERGINDVEDLFHTAYKTLFAMLPNVSSEYANDYLLLLRATQASILSSYSLSYVVFLGVLPQIFKNRAHLGQKVLGLSTADKDGYLLERWRPLLKALLGYPLPFLALWLSNAYSIVLLLVLPYFIDLLFAILSSKKLPLLEAILGIDVIDEKKSVVYKDELIKEIEGSHLLGAYEDPDYVGRLSAKEAMKLGEKEKDD